MTTTACVWAKTLNFPYGGGHRWVYINWALGLRACGVKVIWLESVNQTGALEELQTALDSLRFHLGPYGLSNSIALCYSGHEPVPKELVDNCLSLADATESELLVDLSYAGDEKVVQRFRRSALIDLDPGLTQIWMQNRVIKIAPHDFYFTIGETVSGNTVPEFGLKWIYLPPCIALERWPVTEADAKSPFTTVSHWWGRWQSIDGVTYENSKRAGFLPYLELPKLANRRFELALNLDAESDKGERAMLQEHGWSVRNASEVASTPWGYQKYIQSARGEFSCAKPAYRRLQTAWISDRTLSYLASGRPAVVEHTGSSRFLPDADGLFRFKSLAGALTALRELEANYNQHSRAARALVEEFFDAKQAAARLLEHVLS